MVRVFAENGDRTDRKKARLKYQVDRWAVERFLAETEKKLGFPVLHADAGDCEPRGPIDRAGHLEVHPQSQPGLSYMGVCVPVGWLSAERWPMARALAGSMVGEFGALGGGILPNVLGQSKQHTGSFGLGFACYAAVATMVRLMLAVVSRRWTKTWVGAGGRALAAAASSMAGFQVDGLELATPWTLRTDQSDSTTRPGAGYQPLFVSGDRP